MSDLSEYRHYLGILAWTRGELKKLEERKKELEEAEAEAVELITEELGFADDDEDGTHEGKLDGKTVVTYQQSHQRRLDQKALAEDYPDLVEEYKKRKPVKTLKVVGLK